MCASRLGANSLIVRTSSMGAISLIFFLLLAATAAGLVVLTSSTEADSVDAVSTRSESLE